MQYRKYKIPDERALMAFPMQGRRTIQAGRRLKAEGMRKGLPDMFLALPTTESAGLWLELKATGGKPSPEQVQFGQMLVALGYDFQICYGFDCTVEAITRHVAKWQNA